MQAGCKQDRSKPAWWLARLLGYGNSSVSNTGARAGKCGKSFKVVPYSVLGTSLDGGFNPNAGPRPAPEEVIVDPAGLQFIEYNEPEEAGAAAAAIYNFIGLDEDTGFPEDVRSNVTAVLHAKYHAYPAVGVIHAVGPDMRRGYSTENEAIAALTTVYSNVLREFNSSGKKKLRLLPISSGIFSGRHSSNMPKITFAALQQALEQAAPEVFEAIQEAEVEMCIFEKREHPGFESESERVCADST
eukprot:gnl/MRDRNA2_/MRDRNA2_148303_c0_seq1.p1 gnl/MRDRNA2_/MRDRNA2_148303_c0~~gnl/MRDRNA2_/MRDRNA2_148303_c0_seq1.p1  ORF type:complete len:244 (+),score=48.31 gnl/MRDRNA2_/MRDRNA2_148303_c0_seq1:136-867(+)